MTHSIDSLPPIHPGAFLLDELEAIGVSPEEMADRLSMTHSAVTALINGDQPISPEMAVRLGETFGTTPQYWTNLQAIYDGKQTTARVALSPEEQAAIAASMAEAARNEFATDEEVRAVWARHGL
jgi:antitoxin HigA-1